LLGTLAALPGALPICRSAAGASDVVTGRPINSRRRIHFHIRVSARDELDSQLLDCHPRVQFGEIDADAAFTGTWTHVDGGPVLRLTQASLQPRLRPVTDRALMKRRRTFAGGPHGEPSWHRFEPRLERRYFRTSHFDEAGGRCRPGGSGKDLHCI